MVSKRSSEAAVAAESGSRSLEPGVRWSSSTGGPSALPHSDQATRRPSARVRMWSPIGVVAGVDVIFFTLHPLVVGSFAARQAALDHEEAALHLLPTTA